MGITHSVVKCVEQKPGEFHLFCSGLPCSTLVISVYSGLYTVSRKTRKSCCRKETARCSSSSFCYRAMHVVLARYCYRKSSVRPSVRPSVCLSVCLSVRPSVTLRYAEHIGWTSSKLFTRIISLGSSRSSKVVDFGTIGHQ